MFKRLLFSMVMGLFLFSKIYAGENKNLTQYYYYTKLNVQSDSFAKVFVNLKQKLDSLIKTGDTLETGRHYLYLALVYYKIHLYDSAVSNSLRAVDYLKKTSDTLHLFLTYQNLSGCYGLIGNYGASLYYTRKAYNLVKQIGDSTFLAGVYLNLAMNLKNRDSSLYYLYKALEISKKKKDSARILYEYNNLAYVFANSQPSKAKNYLLQALQYIPVNQINEAEGSIYANLAALYLILNKTDSAIFYAKKSIDVYSKDKSQLRNQLPPYISLIKAYITLKKNDKAIDYLDQFVSIYDSIRRSDMEQYSKMKVFYEIDKYENTIKLLQTQNKLKEEQLKTEKLKFYLALTGIFLIISILVVYIIQNKKLKESYKKIVDANVQKIKIETQRDELKKTLSEIKKTNTTPISNSEAIFEKIIKMFEEEKIYKQHDLSLDSLAKKIGSNRTYISKIINEKTGKNFTEFVNEYRIEEAKRLLCDTKNKRLTIEAIGLEAGFKSKSTFFRVFKNITGVTPSFFLKNIQNEKI